MNMHEHLESWRTAEAAGREAEAEAALAALLVRLPRLDPPSGFAARVAAAAAAESGAGAARRRPWWWASAAALALVTGALAALAAGVAGPVAGPLAGSLAGRLPFARLIDGLTAAVTAFVGWVSGAAGVWGLAADVAGAVATALGTPPVAAAVLVALAVASLALRLLSDLIATERSWAHVTSHG